MQKNNLSKQTFNREFLTNCGLNIQMVVNIEDLPIAILDSIKQPDLYTHKFSQLVLIGHLGRTLWQNINTNGVGTEHPIDEYTVESIEQYFSNFYADNHYEIIYPGEAVIGLQQLGVEAGWHNTSPFKVGINDKWGSWFAYRAVVLADTNFEVTERSKLKSPCPDCASKICMSSCPAGALDSGELNFNACIEYRKQNMSACKQTCLARISCPVGDEYKYSDEQVKYHYTVSMKTIEKYY